MSGIRHTRRVFNSVLVALTVVVMAAFPTAARDLLDFTWSPTGPEIGQWVLFEITGVSPGDIEQAAWDFGGVGCDGSSSWVCTPGVLTCELAAFQYASEGPKNVEVTVTVGGVQQPPVSHVVTVEPTGFCPGGNDDLFVLQSFYAAGAGGSVWRHEMELVNHGAAAAAFAVDWLPRGADNTVPPLTETVSIPGQSAVRFGNVLEEVFGLGSGEIGALRLRSPPPALRMSHHGVNSGGGGTFGWVIPEADEIDGLADGEEGYLIHLAETADLRSNVSCVNMTSDTVSANLHLHQSDGTYLDTLSMNLLPLSNNQANRVFQSFSPVEGYVRIEPSTSGALLSCAGAIVTNSTNDARTEALTKKPGSPTTFYLPRAVHDTVATTDLVLFAPDGSAQARVEFLPTGQDNSSPAFVDLIVPDQQEFRLPAVLANLFSHQGTGSLRITPTSGTVVASAAETKTPSGIDMHRMSRVRPVDDQIAAGELASIIHLTEGVDHQTDIGVVNTSGSPITVTVDLREASGPRLGARTLQLLPFSHEQIDDVFSSVGFPVVPDGLARISTTTPGGSFLAYAVVTELNTQDSWEFRAGPMPAAIFADGFESGQTAGWFSTVP